MNHFKHGLKTRAYGPSVRFQSCVLEGVLNRDLKLLWWNSSPGLIHCPDFMSREGEIVGLEEGCKAKPTRISLAIAIEPYRGLITEKSSQENFQHQLCCARIYSLFITASAVRCS